MSLLGIIGGMGPAATDLLYRRIIDRTDAQCDQDHLDMIILNHASIPDRTAAILGGNTREVEEKLVADAKFLEKSGAGAIAIPCNTSHYFYDAIAGGVNIPVINMVRETVRYVKETGRKKVCVLATDGTIAAGVYEKEIKNAGMEYFCPSGEIQKTVMHIIYDQIKKGFDGSGEDFRKIHRCIKENGCDGAILACTELSVFRAAADLSDFYTDALEILCERAILSCGKKLRERV